jgi:CBS domain-containing protein
MRVAECMSQSVETVTPQQPIREAAQFMLRSDIGALPVTDQGGALTGMITDRDIAVRAVAEGLGPDTPVSEVMTNETITISEDQDIEDAASVMSEGQVRRLPVVSREGGQLVGVISLADISQANDAEAAQVALDGVTEPGGEHVQSEQA